MSDARLRCRPRRGPHRRCGRDPARLHHRRGRRQVRRALPGDRGLLAGSGRAGARHAHLGGRHHRRGVGAAVTGLRPVVEILFIDFLACAMDQICNQAAKMRFMFGGQVRCPW